MGPGEGIQRQRLIDLPTNLVEASDQPSSYAPPVQPRVSFSSFIIII